MKEALDILQAAMDNEHRYVLISEARKGLTVKLRGNLDSEHEDGDMAEAEFLYRHAHSALHSAVMTEHSSGLYRPFSLRKLADALNHCIATYDEAEDKSECINPDEPVVIRMAGPNTYGDDDSIYWHVRSCGGAEVGLDGYEDECHEGVELGVVPIGRGFYFNGRRCET